LDANEFQNPNEEVEMQQVEEVPQVEIQDGDNGGKSVTITKPKRIRKRSRKTPVTVAEGSGKGKAQVKQGKPARARTKAPSVSFTTQLGKDIADRLAVLNAESDQINSERVQLLQAQKALKS
jgi:hypothetical protein